MAKPTKTSTIVESLLTGLVERLEKLETSAVEQFPDICKEIVAERKVELQNQAIQMGLVSKIINGIAIFMSIRALDSVNGDGRILWGIGALLALGFGIATLADTLGAVLKLRELKAAPKLYVLRQLKHLISRK